MAKSSTHGLGAFASGEEIELTDPLDRTSLNCLRSQCMFAITPRDRTQNEDSMFLAAVVLKLLQRESLSRFPGAFERALKSDFVPLKISGDAKQEISTTVPKVENLFQLDPAFNLHPTLELPFWKAINNSDPEICK